MKLILGSKSPRRKELLKEIIPDFEIRVLDTDESYSSSLTPKEIATSIAKKKAEALKSTLNEEEVLLTSDTIVCINDEVLGKPKDEDEAVEMLQKLSGKAHSVITAVCLLSKEQFLTDTCETIVHVKPLSIEEIQFYVQKYQPYDKAGAYGIQEWFGAIAITKIEGSYNNVVGLPTHIVYELIKQINN